MLVACAPTADDCEAIEPYDGDPILLAKVERFFYEVQAADSAALTESPQPAKSTAAAAMPPCPADIRSSICLPLPPSSRYLPTARHFSAAFVRMQVYDVPLFTKRLFALQARQTFTAAAAHCATLLESVCLACSETMASDGLTELLSLTLLAGNVLNSGTARGDAKGCQLDVLLKLRDVKSMKSGASTDLLRVLVRAARVAPACRDIP